MDWRARASAFWPHTISARRLYPALVALALSAELFAYTVCLQPDRERATRADGVTAELRAGQAALAARLRALDGAMPADPPAERMDLLRQADMAAAQTGARVVRIAPLPGSPTALDVEVEAAFPVLAQFIGQLEARRALIQRLVLRPAASGTIVEPRLAATFILDGRAGGGGLANPDASAATLMRATSDPFAPSIPPADIAAQHRLTGITAVDQDLLATIDGHDYRQGDAIDGATILAINDDAVELGLGSRRYWLRFQPRRR